MVWEPLAASCLCSARCGRPDQAGLAQLQRLYASSRDRARQTDRRHRALAIVTKHVGSLGDLLGRWLEATAPDSSAYTVHEYTRMINRNIKPELGDVRLELLTARHLDTFCSGPAQCRRTDRFAGSTVGNDRPEPTRAEVLPA